MPFIHVYSSVPKAGVDTTKVIKEFSSTLADTLERQEAFVMSKLSLDQTILFAGTDAVRCIGQISKEHNTKSVQVLTAKVTELLGVPAERVFIIFEDIPAVNWGMSGVTVDTLL
ncbi:Atls1-like light-inducible protein, partial [Globisporangium splendens]